MILPNRDASLIVIFVITEYLLKYSTLIKCLRAVDTMREKSAATLAIAMVILVSTMASMESALSSSTSGKIDVFTQHEPYSGKGPNVPSDAFGPGDIVILYALVSYSNVSVQNLIVTFYVNPPDSLSFSVTAKTNASGIASINFTVPQNNDNITQFFGEWFVLTNVPIGEDLLQDTLTFRVDWVVKIVSVRTIDENLTSRSEFGIGGDVGLEITIRSIAMSIRNATLAIVIQDELSVPVNSSTINDFEVQPNEKLVFIYCKLYLPKWTHIGNASVSVSALTAPADQGGVAYCPEVSAGFFVSIYGPLTLNFHDVAIVKVVLSTTSVKSGEPVYIDVTVRNEGTAVESFNVSAYYTDRLIGTSTIVGLTSYSSIIVPFTFDTTGLDPGDYTISILIPQLINETDLTDNLFIDGIIEIKPAIKQYYLTVRTNPLGIVSISGEGWYDEGTNVSLTAPEYVLASTGVRYRFGYWDIDEASQSDNPIFVTLDADHVATAHYILQYYLMVISPYGKVGGEGWYDAGITAYATLEAGIVDHENGTRRVFTNWSGDASGTNYTNSDPIIMDSPKTALANWKVQYGITFTYTGLDSSSTGEIVNVNGSLKTFGELPYTLWVDSGSIIAYSYNNVSSSVTGKRFILTGLTGPMSPITVTSPVTVSGNYKTQYYLTVRTDPLGLTSISGEGWYDQFENVTLSASPFGEYDFGNWDVDGVTRGANVKTVIVYMDNPHVATAHYNLHVEGWYVPDWFYWVFLFLLLVILPLILLLALLYRRRRKKPEESFYRGWTAWYYGYDLRSKTTNT
jgi:hypothetical protein